MLKNIDIPITHKLESVAGWILDKKGSDLLALDVTAYHTFTECIIIVTATSPRHAQGIADHILEECRVAHFEFLHMEGYQSGQWILIDLNDLVVSIFQKDARTLYRLEDLWKSARIIKDTRQTVTA